MANASQLIDRKSFSGSPKANGTPAHGPVGARAVLLSALERVAPVPWQAAAGSTTCAHRKAAMSDGRTGPQPLYTAEQRQRRDSSVWTLVQGVLAPIQFLVFLVSLGLVINYLRSGDGYGVATLSVIAKTGILYLIMVTGAIWEKVVFDKWLFAEAFFWEDVFSMLVLGLHTLYLGAVVLHWGSPQAQMLLALAAYATYVVNAGQFIWKLRMARLQGGQTVPAGSPA
jgi:3-vinyl bacteriochlorophyllide hydratase